MKFNMDIKSLIFIITTACVAVGYYYNIESRLDSTEREIKFLWSSVGDLERQNKRLNRIINKKGSSKNK